MASTNLPVRLVICVDGTYCTADGPEGRGYGNISNVYRICASVKTGKCVDEVTQQELVQEKRYENGIGSADNIGSLERLKAGFSGHGCEKVIKKIYEKCCRLDAKDEIWFYGFSRGAYIVRAVASLLHYIGALKSAGGNQFEADYSKALKVYSDFEQRSRIGPGQIHSFLSLSTKPAPRIQFVGVFDTVKALDDGQLYDIPFNDSIQHFRHALSLNENREAMTPEYVFPNYSDTKIRLSKRSFIQAWFIGAHIDMGGSAEKDGLSLYPLQWILIESQSNGLALEFSASFNDRARIDDPLRVVFPKNEIDGKGRETWTGTTKNKVKVSMQDLRNVHKSQAYRSRYSIRLNKREAHLWPKKARKPFNPDGSLKGYCIFAPQGTIIHPSVYQLLDEFLVTALTKDALAHRENLEKWRSKMLGEKSDLLNQGFWTERGTLEIEDLKSIRILVCGNTGVGKSTLINQVFGVSGSDEVTKSSDRKRGLHDIREEIIHKDRPDLVIHDSGGFEAGDESQIQAVENFVKEKATRTQLEDRLHIIWFCIEMNSARTQQTATEALFRAVSKYAAEVPIIVVATKMDQFRGFQRQEAWDLYRESTNDITELDRKCQKYAAKQLKERMEEIEKEMREVERGRFDACVDVARNDKESMKRLNNITLQNVNNEKIRLHYIAAQTANIDLKIDCAIIETMKIYRDVLRSVSGTVAIPAASSSNRTAAAIAVCRAIVKCFGLPTVNFRTIYEVVKCNLWDDLGHNLSVVLAEGIATTASDLILILASSFKQTTLTCIGQPLVKDVENAANRYRPISNKVHKEIMRLVPKRNLVKSFRYNYVQLGLEKIVHSFKVQVMDADPRTSIPASRLSFSSEDTEVDAEIRDMEKDIKMAEAELQRGCEKFAQSKTVRA